MNGLGVLMSFIFIFLGLIVAMLVWAIRSGND